MTQLTMPLSPLERAQVESPPPGPRNGEIFCRLTFLGKIRVVSYQGKKRVKRIKKGLFRCVCGTECWVAIQKAMSGYTQSCGCLQRERARESATTHGLSKKASEYGIWTNMKTRCLNKNYYLFKDYGGRGITVCKKWRESFFSFFSDIGSRPSEHHYLDRIDVNGNYEPGNVRWATLSQHARNKRNVLPIRIGDVEHLIPEWAEISGIDKKNIWRRLKQYGWSPYKAVFYGSRRGEAQRGVWEYKLVPRA